MADISDVINALVAIAGQTLYPNGMAQDSIVGVPLKIYPGWPNAATLDADMAALSAGTGGAAHVSVYPRPDERPTTRYMATWAPLMTSPATLTVSQDGQSFTMGGTVSVPQNVAVLLQDIVYTYAVQASDTLTTIATALAALVPGASSAGPVVTLPAAAVVNAIRVGGSGQMIRELRRQTRTVQLTVWPNSPVIRDAVIVALDNALVAMEFITLPDQSAGRLLYHSSPETDALSKVQIYRRDLFYTVEFATTQTSTATEVVAIELETSVAMPDGTSEPISTTYE